AAVAYPSYQNHVIKTRRGAGAACLTELAQFMERYYTTTMSYQEAELPQTGCRTELAAFYTFAFDQVATARAFSISATATGAQIKDSRCGNLTLNQAGTKSVSVNGTPVGECF
ncbi:MAG TPA: type IV pilin protein, partial [Lysobacter sp.]|nr:type IV pilin protein [Lysobacter sp.]